MIHAIVIDDEPRALTIIRKYAEKISHLELTQTFRSGIDAAEFLSGVGTEIDLLFLDINMPDMDGISFLKTLKNPPMVIFTTAYSEYAVESYDFDAIGYLLKPFDFGKFYKAVQRARKLQELKNQEQTSIANNQVTKPSYLLVKNGSQTLKLNPADIHYIEAAGNYSEIVTAEKQILTDHSLSDLEDLLPAGSFYRIHRSYIIHLKYLEIVENHQVQVADTHIPLGKTYRKEFLKVFKK